MPTLDDTPILRNLVALKANDLIPVSDTSASGSKVVKVPAALLAQGFTHAFRIDYNNAELLAETVDDTDEQITLMAIPANSVIDKVRVVVTTAFTGLTACNVFVGRTADDDGYITLASGSVLAKTVIQNTGAEIDTINELDVITASDQNLLITFDPGANAEALDELTAGSLIVLVSLTEIADYASIATAQ
jgi:hypothetical protein